MNGLMLQDRDRNALAAQPSRVHVDIDLEVTRYHIEQARTQRRREKSRADAPKRAAARKTAIDAAIDAANQIVDADERKAALAEIDNKAAASKRIAEEARSERELVRRRMKHGFVSAEAVEVGGRVRAPFRQKGLKSDTLGKAGKLFVRGCRKGRALRSANEKGFIMNQHRSKLLSLDYAWVEGNREMVSLIRIDLDRFFESFEHLRDSIQRLVNEGRIPCQPHLVAGDLAPVMLAGGDVTRMLVRPHLWFILPEAVNMMATGRKGPQRLLDAVYRGLCNVLMGLGADPNARALLVRGKSPLAPWWESENFNDDVFPSLSGYAAVLGDAMKVSQEQLARSAAEKSSGLAAAVSNQFFTAASKEAWRILRDLHQRKDREYLAALGDRSRLAEMLARLMPMEHVLLLGEGLVEPARGAYVLDKVIGYAASRWSPEKADEAIAFRSRGTMGHLMADAQSLSEKQAIAGKAVAEKRMQQARHAVLKAMDAVERSGAPFTQAEVARASGLNRKTVSRHWRFCLGRRPGRCLDKKGGVSPVVHDMTQAGQDVAHSNVDARLGGGRKDMTVKQQVENRGPDSVTGDGRRKSPALPRAPVPASRAGIVRNGPTVASAASAAVGDGAQQNVAPAATETPRRDVPAVDGTSVPRKAPVLPPLFLYPGEARKREEQRRELARLAAAPLTQPRRNAGRGRS